MPLTEKQKRYNKDYYNRNKELIALKAKARRLTGYYDKFDKIKNAKRKPESVKDWFLQKKYGITVADWDRIFENQGNACASCGTLDSGRTGKKGGWATDHCHVTGKVRGILCQSCNIALGWLGDQYEIVKAKTEQLLAYLKNSGIK